jgi:uncharacterized membrane protein YbhN (UPF0104 family)
MAVRIVEEFGTAETAVSFAEACGVVERNRDRIRTLGGMITSTSGLFVSISLGIILFAVGNKQNLGTQRLATLIWLLLIGLLLLISSSALAIFSGVFRRSFTIIDQRKFLDDLLQLYHSELRLMRLSLACFFLGLSEMFISIMWFSLSAL